MQTNSNVLFTKSGKCFFPNAGFLKIGNFGRIFLQIESSVAAARNQASTAFFSKQDEILASHLEILIGLDLLDGDVEQVLHQPEHPCHNAREGEELAEVLIAQTGTDGFRS